MPFIRSLAMTALLAAVLGACASAPAKKTGAEGSKRPVVARVNGAPITRDALLTMMNRLGPPREGDAAATTEEVKEKALDRLIFRELAFQQARVQGIGADPKAVDAAITNLMHNLGGEQEYRAYLASQGLSEAELRAEVERSLTLEQIYKREVLDKLVLPEQDIRAEYEREKGRFVKPERVVVIDVQFLQKPEAPGAVKNAKTVLKKILADENRDPWKLVLDGTFQVRTLELLKDRHPELYAKARTMTAGQLSGVVRAPEGLHIIKLKEYEPERQFTLEETRGLLEGKFRVQAQGKRLQEWEQDLRKNATIEIVDQGPAPAGVKNAPEGQ